eukprot:COSAG02_NODE_51933_length_311_cov_0.636792_1_plen_33_part_10
MAGGGVGADAPRGDRTREGWTVRTAYLVVRCGS